MTPRDTLRRGADAAAAAKAAAHGTPAGTRAPGPDSFSPVVHLDAISRHFRPARERAAREAARVADRRAVEIAMRDARVRRRLRRCAERAAMTAAWQAAENEGWNLARRGAAATAPARRGSRAR